MKVYEIGLDEEWIKVLCFCYKARNIKEIMGVLDGTNYSELYVKTQKLPEFVKNKYLFKDGDKWTLNKVKYEV